jgi:hypothetical protein
MQNDVITKSVRHRFWVIAGWVAIIFPLTLNTIYGQFFCKYGFLPIVFLSVLLVVPALIWQFRGYHIAAFWAGLSVLGWIAWANHHQCISDAGPFVGGLGVLYLLFFGLSISITAGLCAEFSERYFRKRHRLSSEISKHKM